MGTINYYTSDYITLGLKPYDYNDFINDKYALEEAQQHVDEYGGTIESYIYNLMRVYENDDYLNIKTELEKYRFYYYNITIKPGYYEGFSIMIENNFSIAFDGYEDKREANKEITQIRKFLTTCANMGLVQCFPGWSMGYSDYTQTIKAISEAVREMRDKVKTTPTWKQYSGGGAAWLY